MKNLKLLALILALGGAVFGQSQTAPPVINYQGRLTQSTGVVVPDGLTGMRVRIFATASGGSALWDSGDLSVATKSGTFSILLGTGGMPAMSPAVFALGTVYIEVQPTGQAPLLPRQPIASVPWSLYAQTVSDGSISTLKLANASVTNAKLVDLSVSTLKLAADAVTTAKIANLAVTEGKLADGAVTNRVLASDSASLTKVTGGTMHVSSNSNIGIGTSVPYARLQIKSSSNDSTRNLFVIDDLDAVESGGTSFSVRGYPGPIIGVHNHWTDLQFGAGNTGGVLHRQVALTTSGNFGIGTLSPGARLDVNGNAIVSGNLNVSGGASLGNLTVPNVNTSNIISPGSGGVLYLNPFAGNAQTVQVGAFQNCNLTVLGRITTSDASPTKAGPGNTWTISSDARLKKNIHPLDNSLSKLLGLRGVTYEYRNPTRGSGRYPGFIAQDVQKVFPDWVTTGPDGYLRVGPIGFEAYTVEAMRALKSEIDLLRQQNARLQAVNRTLESRLVQLERTTTDLQHAIEGMPAKSNGKQR